MLGTDNANLPSIQNKSLFDMIGGQFWLNLLVSVANALSTVVFTIVRWILNIVDFLQFFCKHLIGLDYWESGNVSIDTMGESDIIFKFLYNESVQKVFRAMIGIFIVLLIIFAIIAIVKNQYAVASDADKADNNPMTIMKRCFRAIFLVVLVPLMLVMGILASNAVLAGLVNALNVNNRLTLGGQVFVSSAYDASRYRKYAENGLRYNVTNQVNVTIDVIIEGKTKSVTKKISSAITPITPKDYDEDNPFTGFCFKYKDDNYLYYVDSSELEDNFEYYKEYLQEILGVTLLKYSQIDAEKFNVSSDTNGYAIQAVLTHQSQSSILNKAAYNTWNYNSLFYHHSDTFENTVTSTDTAFTADSGHTYSDAKTYTNNSVWGALYDGGENGLVALPQEYYVMADMIDFAIGDATSIAFVNARSSAIDWSYSGKDGSGYLSSRYINTTGTTMNSFVVNYNDIGYVVYNLDTSNDNANTAETDGEIYICAYYSSARGKYIPIVNGKTYVDDYGETHKFSSDYLDANYEGLIVARGILESEFSNQYGYPTEIDVDWSSASADGSISTETPKYFTASGRANVVSVAEVESSGDTSITFNNTLTNLDNGKIYMQNQFVSDLTSASKIFENGNDVALSLPKSFTYRTKNLTGQLGETQVYEEKLVALSGIEWAVHDIAGNEVVFTSNKYIEFYTSSDEYRTSPLYARVSCINAGNNQIQIKFYYNDGLNDKYLEIPTNVPTNDVYIVKSSIAWPAQRTDISSSTGSVLNEIAYNPNQAELVLATLIKLPGAYAHNVIDGFDESKLVSTEYSGTKTMYYYANGGDIIRVTHDSSDHSVSAYVNQTFKFKVDGSYLKVGRIIYTARPYDLTLSKTYTEGSNTVYGYRIYHSESQTYYYFEFTCSNADGIETYTPKSTTLTQVLYYQFNMFTYLKSGAGGMDNIKAINPVTGGETDATILASKSVLVSNDLIEKKYITTNTVDGEKKYIWQVTVNVDDKDKSVFASFYTYGESNTSLGNVVSAINQAYRASIGKYDLEVVPLKADVATGIEGSVLATTATINFNRQTVTANDWRADLQIFSAIFTKNTFRFKIAFGSAFSGSKTRTSSFQIIGASLKLDYNFKSTFASGLDLKIFYIPMKLNIIILVFAACMLLSVLGKAVWGLVQRIYDITLYFIVMPGVASVMPFDGGGRFSDWSKKVVGKVLGAYGVMLGLNIFFILCPAIKEVSHLFTEADLMTLSEGNFLRSVTPGFINSVSELLFMLVALTMIKSAPEIITSIIGFGAEDVVKKGENAKKNVKDMVANAGKTISGQEALEAGKNFTGQLKNFVPGSAIADDIKNKIKAGKKKVEEGKEKADHAAKQEAEARRRNDAINAYNNGMQKQEEANEINPTINIETADGSVGEAPSVTTNISERGAQTVQDSARQGAQEAIENMENAPQEAQASSEQSGRVGYADVAGSLEGGLGERSLKVEFVNNEGDNSVSNINTNIDGRTQEVLKNQVADVAQETLESKASDVAQDALESKASDVAQETVKKSVFDTNSVADWAKEAGALDNEIAEYEAELERVKKDKFDAFTKKGDEYYGYDEQTGKFIARQFNKEVTESMTAEQKQELASDIADYNEYYKLADQEQHDLEDIIEEKKRDRDEVQSIISDLEEKQTSHTAQETQEVVQETVDTETIKDTVRETAGQTTQQIVENATEQATANIVTEAQQYAEKSKLHAEASKSFADASQGFADIATGNVDKNYGIKQQTKDEAKLEKLLAKRDERLQKQIDGNADVGLNLFERSKAYKKFNGDKILEDSIYDANTVELEKEAIKKWNKTAGKTKIDEKLSTTDAKLLTEKAVSEWKDEQALKLYNNKKGTSIDKVEDMSKKQLSEARKLQEKDQATKKAIARSEFKDSRIDKKIAKQQEKIALKEAGLYESAGKKAVLALPRVFSRKLSDKDMDKYQAKMDKWEQKGKELSSKLENENLSVEERTELQEQLGQARRRYDAYSAQMRNGRGGWANVWAREAKNGGRIAKSKLQSGLESKLMEAEKNIEKATATKTADKDFATMSNFNWKEYLGKNEAVDHSKAEYTAQQRGKLQEEAKKIDQAKREREYFMKQNKIHTSFGEYDEVQTMRAILKSQGKTYTKARAEKLRDDPEYIKMKEKYDSYGKIIDSSSANIRSMATKFDIENRNFFAKRGEHLKKAQIRSAKAEKMRVVSELNTASRSGRLDEKQESRYIEQIQGYDASITKLKEETFKYGKVRKAIDATKRFGGSMMMKAHDFKERMHHESARDLARRELANEPSVKARLDKIATQNEETARKTAEAIAKEEARKAVQSDNIERDYINKIRRALAQSGFAGDIAKIATTNDAQRVRAQLEKELLSKQSEIRKKLTSGILKENEQKELKLQEKLINQRLRKLKSVDLENAGIGANVNIRNEIKNTSESTVSAKMRNEYKTWWNEFSKRNNLRDTAKSGSSAYEKNLQWQKRLEDENKKLQSQVKRLQEVGVQKTDSRIKTLTNQIASQESMIKSLKSHNAMVEAKAKKALNTANGMDKLMRDMRRQSKYKIKGLDSNNKPGNGGTNT